MYFPDIPRQDVSTGSRSHYCIWSSPTMQFTIPGGTEAVRYLRKIEKVLQNSVNWARKKIQIENSRLEVEIRMSDAAMHRTLMRYCRTVYSCTRPEVVNIWHVCTLCVHCCVRCVHCTIFLCVHCVHCVHQQLYISQISNRFFGGWKSAVETAVENRPLLLSWVKQN